MTCESSTLQCLQANTQPMYLWQIQQWIRSHHGKMYDTTAISARIRELRVSLSMDGLTIHNTPKPKERAGRYWIGKA